MFTDSPRTLDEKRTRLLEANTRELPIYRYVCVYRYRCSRRESAVRLYREIEGLNENVLLRGEARPFFLCYVD